MRNTLRSLWCGNAVAASSRMPGWPATLAVALAMVLTLMLSACGDGPDQSLDTVLFKVDETANNTAPVAVDIVYVRDKKLLDQISSFTAMDWLAKRAQLIRDNPDVLEVRSWELVPGQVLTADLSDADDAYGILVFANYATPGAHRLRIGADASDITLKVGVNDIELQQQS